MLKAGTTRNLIFSGMFSLYAPEHISQEIFKYKSEIMGKAHLDEGSFGMIFSLTLSQVRIVPSDLFSGKLAEAARICQRHPEDIPFVALALHMGIPVWTHDKEFSRHPEIRAFSTKELIDSFMR
jgi:predicted nucleic acid-binding protein